MSGIEAAASTSMPMTTPATTSVSDESATAPNCPSITLRGRTGCAKCRSTCRARSACRCVMPADRSSSSTNSSSTVPYPSSGNCSGRAATKATMRNSMKVITSASAPISAVAPGWRCTELEKRRQLLRSSARQIATALTRPPRSSAHPVEPPRLARRAPVLAVVVAAELYPSPGSQIEVGQRLLHARPRLRPLRLVVTAFDRAAGSGGGSGSVRDFAAAHGAAANRIT